MSGIGLIAGDPQIYMPFGPFAVGYSNCHNKKVKCQCLNQHIAKHSISNVAKA